LLSSTNSSIIADVAWRGGARDRERPSRDTAAGSATVVTRTAVPQGAIGQHGVPGAKARPAGWRRSEADYLVTMM